jgi:hypothetical protein
MNRLKNDNVLTSGKNQMQPIALNVILGKLDVGMEQWRVKPVGGTR